MKKIAIVVVSLVVAFLVLTVMKNGLIQTVLGASLSSAAHVPVRIGGTDARLLSGFISLSGISIDNPRGFPERRMVVIPRLTIDLEPASLLKNRAHFEEVRLDLAELTVIKNRKGELNVNALKPSPAEKEKAKKAQEPDKKGSPKPTLQIDKLVLSIGRVTYKDYSGGGEPKVQVFDIQIKDRIYTNIQNPSMIVSLIMMEALTRTTLSRLADLDMDVFKDGAAGALGGGLELLKDGTQTFEDTTKGVLKLFS